MRARRLLLPITAATLALVFVATPARAAWSEAVVVDGAGPFPEEVTGSPALAVDPDGNAFLAWARGTAASGAPQFPGENPTRASAVAMASRAAFQPFGAPTLVSGPEEGVRALALAAATGRAAPAWTAQDSAAYYRVRLLESGGPETVSPHHRSARFPQVAVAVDGSRAVAWQEVLDGPPTRGRHPARALYRFAPPGREFGPTITLAEGPEARVGGLVTSADGFVGAWTDGSAVKAGRLGPSGPEGNAQLFALGRSFGTLVTGPSGTVGLTTYPSSTVTELRLRLPGGEFGEPLPVPFTPEFRHDIALAADDTVWAIGTVKTAPAQPSLAVASRRPGQAFDSPQILGPGSFEPPHIAIDGEGNVFATWARLNWVEGVNRAAGEGWGPVTRVSPEGRSIGAHALAALPAGGAVAAWVRTADHGCGFVEYADYTLGPAAAGSPSPPSAHCARRDAIPPRLSRFRVIGAARPAQVRFAYQLSEEADLHIWVERIARGDHPVRRPRDVGEPGRNVFRWRPSRPLQPGRYRATAGAVDAARNRSGALSVSFRVGR